MLLRPSRFEAEGPGFAGPLRLFLLLAIIVVLPAPAARAHGGVFEVVVETVNRSDDPTQLAYGVVLTFVDGHAVTGATVTVTASSGSEPAAEVVAVETTPGVYIADLTLKPGPWRVTVDIETDDTEGSVEFTEEVGEMPLTRPVVRVDTADPDRQGQVVTDSAVFAPPDPPQVGETDLELRVEALVRDAVAPLVVEYGVVTGSVGGTVSISALSDRSVTVGPVSMSELTAGVFSGEVSYPGAGTWEVTVEVEGPGGGVATFGEALPWPHYTTEAGSPKIKLDSEDPALVGTLIDLGDSAIFGQVGTGTTEPGPPTTVDEGEVVVSIPTSGSEIGFQVMLRWLHLAGIGMWGASIAIIGLGRRRPIWSGLAVVGMIAVLATGTALALWGAPTGFPGIFSWSELGARLYGASYQWAFLVKMALVLTAVVATVLLVFKSTLARLAVAAAGMLGALAAVVAMAQLHLFAHL